MEPSPRATQDHLRSPKVSQGRAVRQQKKTKRVVRGTEVRLLQLRFRARAGKMCVVQAQDFWLLRHKNANQMTYTVTVLQYRTVHQSSSPQHSPQHSTVPNVSLRQDCSLRASYIQKNRRITAVNSDSLCTPKSTSDWQHKRGFQVYHVIRYL